MPSVFLSKTVLLRKMVNRKKWCCANSAGLKNFADPTPLNQAQKHDENRNDQFSLSFKRFGLHSKILLFLNTTIDWSNVAPPIVAKK